MKSYSLFGFMLRWLGMAGVGLLIAWVGNALTLGNLAWGVWVVVVLATQVIGLVILLWRKYRCPSCDAVILSMVVRRNLTPCACHRCGCFPWRP